jgi:Fic family protein
LQHLYDHKNERTTLLTHMNVSQVTKMTASKDLKALVNKGFLTSRKQGRNVYYYGTKKIQKLF